MRVANMSVKQKEEFFAGVIEEVKVIADAYDVTINIERNYDAVSDLTKITLTNGTKQLTFNYADGLFLVSYLNTSLAAMLTEDYPVKCYKTDTGLYKYLKQNGADRLTRRNLLYKFAQDDDKAAAERKAAMEKRRLEYELLK